MLRLLSRAARTVQARTVSMNTRLSARAFTKGFVDFYTGTKQSTSSNTNTGTKPWIEDGIVKWYRFHKNTFLNKYMMTSMLLGPKSLLYSGGFAFNANYGLVAATCLHSHRVGESMCNTYLNGSSFIGPKSLENNIKIKLAGAYSGVVITAGMVIAGNGLLDVLNPVIHTSGFSLWFLQNISHAVADIGYFGLGYTCLRSAWTLRSAAPHYVHNIADMKRNFQEVKKLGLSPLPGLGAVMALVVLVGVAVNTSLNDDQDRKEKDFQDRIKLSSTNGVSTYRGQKLLSREIDRLRKTAGPCDSKTVEQLFNTASKVEAIGLNERKCASLLHDLFSETATDFVIKEREYSLYRWLLGNKKERDLHLRVLLKLKDLELKTDTTPSYKKLRLLTYSEKIFYRQHGFEKLPTDLKIKYLVYNKSLTLLPLKMQDNQCWRHDGILSWHFLRFVTQRDTCRRYRDSQIEEQLECLAQPAVADTHGAAMTEDEKMMAETLDRIRQIESALGIKEQINDE